MRLEALEIDDHIEDKIASKHGVGFWEAEEAFFNEGLRLRKARAGTYRLYSQIEAGRYLLLVAAYTGNGNWRLATARDMTQTERRMYVGPRGVRP